MCECANIKPTLPKSADWGDTDTGNRFDVSKQNMMFTLNTLTNNTNYIDK